MTASECWCSWVGTSISLQINPAAAGCPSRRGRFLQVKGNLIKSTYPLLEEWMNESSSTRGTIREKRSAVVTYSQGWYLYVASTVPPGGPSRGGASGGKIIRTHSIIFCFCGVAAGRPGVMMPHIVHLVTLRICFSFKSVWSIFVYTICLYQNVAFVSKRYALNHLLIHPIEWERFWAHRIYFYGNASVFTELSYINP